MKGRRNDENENLHIVMISKSRVQYNGLMFFFALTIADNALKGYETLDDLMKVRLPEDRDSWELEWKENACNLPVLRIIDVIRTP